MSSKKFSASMLLPNSRTDFGNTASLFAVPHILPSLMPGAPNKKDKNHPACSCRGLVPSRGSGFCLA